MTAVATKMKNEKEKKPVPLRTPLIQIFFLFFFLTLLHNSFQYIHTILDLSFVFFSISFGIRTNHKKSIQTPWLSVGK
jgi:hypothetical protein